MQTESKVMSSKLDRILAQMTRSEQAQVEAFAAFIVVRRQLQRARLVSDDIPAGELTALVAASGSFDWLDADEEDVYSVDDGESVQWPRR